MTLTNRLDRNIISNSHSPWSSPIILVQNKDRSLRFCVDYCKVNEVTRKDAYPLPHIDDFRHLIRILHVHYTGPSQWLLAGGGS